MLNPLSLVIIESMTILNHSSLTLTENGQLARPLSTKMFPGLLISLNILESNDIMNTINTYGRSRNGRSFVKPINNAYLSS